MILYIFRVALVIPEEETLWTLSELLPFTSTILSCSERYICYTYFEYVLDSAWFICHHKTLTSTSTPQPSQQLGHQKSLKLWVSRCYMSQQMHGSHFSFLSSLLPILYSFFPSFILSFSQNWNHQRKGCVWNMWKYTRIKPALLWGTYRFLREKYFSIQKLI